MRPTLATPSCLSLPRRPLHRPLVRAAALALPVLGLLITPACAQGTASPASPVVNFTLPCTEPAPGTEVSTIAFGSCAREERPQPIWHAIADQNPQVFLFLGDNIYADSPDMNVHRADYARLNAAPGLQRLCTQGTAVLATWDDHDYGKNDAGVEWTAKREAQAVFLDWLGVPAGSPRRAREGIYHSVIVGPVGRRVQFIMLDTRTFRSPITERQPGADRAYGKPGSYEPSTDPAATLLGDQQWKWLEDQLRQPAEIRIIGSSIQFAAIEHRFEHWGNLPRERARMLELLSRTGASGVIFLSGDRHHAEMSRLTRATLQQEQPERTTAGTLASTAPDAASPTALPYPIWDVTSSGLNQTKGWGNEVNRHRVGGVYLEENFGLIHIAWDQPDPLITLEVRDVSGTAVMKQDVKLSELRAN